MNTEENKWEISTHKLLEQVIKAGFNPAIDKKLVIDNNTPMPAGVGLGNDDEGYYVTISTGICSFKIPCRNYESARLVAAVVNRHTMLLKGA